MRKPAENQGAPSAHPAAPEQPGTLPPLQLTGRGQARVKLNGVYVYCGRAGTAASHEAYEKAIARWLASGKKWPSTSGATLSTKELCRRFREWTAGYYVKNGRPTPTVARVRLALELLAYADLTGIPAAEFSIADLREFQRYLAADPERRWARSTINSIVRVVIAMFRWAHAENYVPESVARSLATIRHLPKGRSLFGDIKPPREGKKRLPVPEPDLQAALAKCGPAVASMIRLQLASAMRPGEVVAIRAADINPTVVPGVFVYTPREHKTEHHDLPRQIFLGPKAMAELAPWVTADESAPLFSPRASAAAAHAARRAARKTPAWPSHDPEKRRAKRLPAAQPRNPGDAYSVASYRRAINRACLAAKVPPWSPHQLRHNAASYIAQAESLQVAQLILGHQSISTTMLYVHTPDRAPLAAMLKHG